MRIDGAGHTMDKIASTGPVDSQAVKAVEIKEQQSSSQANEPKISKEKLQQAVDAVNEFFEINHSELKFVFHDGLEKYFVQLVNADTKEVVKEIPSKKLLDVYYEMQKLVGMIVDEKI